MEIANLIAYFRSFNVIKQNMNYYTYCNIRDFLDNNMDTIYWFKIRFELVVSG